MSEFNTHGGYFAPAGYMKVEEGGSHEENPNGGVQIGVDPQGVPNMLEEGEPVYNDFVFSDNIKVSKEMAEKHKLPKSIIGKLYSDAAEYFIDEAKERPFDASSRNGLESMLSRLADAQEEQKQIDMQEELEEQLSQMSPEELAQLEALLSAQDQGGQQVPEQAQIVQPIAPVAEVPTEQVVVPGQGMPVATEAAPVQAQIPMACGGKISRKFELGGDIPPARTLILDPNTGNYYAEGEVLSGVPFNVNPESVNFDVPVSYGGGIEPSVSIAYPGKSQEWVDAETSGIKKRVAEGSNQFISDAADVAYKASEPLEFVMPGVGVARGTYDVLNGNVGSGITNIALSAVPAVGEISDIKALGKIGDEIKQISGKIGDWERQIKESEEIIKTAKERLKSAKNSDVDMLKKQIENAKDRIKLCNSEIKRLKSRMPKMPNSTADNVVDEVAVGATKTQKAAKAKKILKTTGNVFYHAALPEFALMGDIWKATKGLGDGKLAKLGRGALSTLGGAAGTGISYLEKKAFDPGLDKWNSTRGTNTAEEYEADRGNNPFSNYANGGRMNVYDEGTGNLSRGPVGYRTSFVANDDSDRTYGWADWLKSGVHHMGNLLRIFRGGQESNERLGPNPSYYVGSQEQRHGVSEGEVLGPPVPTGPVAVSEGEYLGPPKPTSVGTRNGNGTAATSSAQPSTRVIGSSSSSSNTPVQEEPSVPLFLTDNGPRDDLRDLARATYGYYSGPTEPNVPIILTDPGDKESILDLSRRLFGRAYGNNPVTSNSEKAEDGVGGHWAISSLPVFPRYAGAIGSGLLALQTALQEPDRYDLPHVALQTPEGRIHLQNQRYNPIDYNMVANSLLAQGNATARGLRNSGLGPSSAAAQVAADYNLGRNLGTGFIQTRDANNQQRNAVIAANNQAETQRAPFDYGVDSTRKQILNQGALYDLNLDLTKQRLNNAAESEQYAAISTNLSNALQGVSNIGRENFTMNQINSNRALYDYLFPNGIAGYKGAGNTTYNLTRQGGLLKKYKK